MKSIASFASHPDNLMANLQPRTFSADGGLPHGIRLTSIRGFMSDTVRLTGHQVREIWQKRFQEKGPAHRYWLYTHIPFCPQICTFCQCSTSLRKSDRQVADYLHWLEGEIDFLKDTSESGLSHSSTSVEALPTFFPMSNWNGC